MLPDRVIVKQYGGTKASWACAVLVLRFSNHSILRRSQLLGAYRYANNLRKNLHAAGKEIEGQWQVLMFGSRIGERNREKKRNYAPRVANSWLRHCSKSIFSLVKLFDFLSENCDRYHIIHHSVAQMSTPSHVSFTRQFTYKIS